MSTLLRSVAHPSSLYATLWYAAVLASNGGKLLALVGRFGLLGLFPVSIVDSSFVPLPIPGVTDIMLVLFAAQTPQLWRAILLVAIATTGSALGGFFSYQVGHAGGMSFIENRIPKRIFKQVTRWMESHAILAVSIPALLPPPMPLSPFVLAAGALKMSRSKFMWAFTVSRLLRHAIAVALGAYFGPRVLTLWNNIMGRWGTPILIVLWTGIAIGCAYAFFQLYKTRKSLRGKGQPASAKA